MYLKNYLMKMSEFDYKRNRNSDRHTIHISGLNGIIRNCLNEIKENIEYGNYIKVICKNLKVSKPTIDSWSTGYNSIPIRKMYGLLLLWKKICKKSNTQLEKKWDEVYKISQFFSSPRNPKVRLPKILSEDLGYILGFMMADGHIKNESKNLERNKYPEHSISVCDNSYDFLIYFKTLFDKIFSTNSNKIRFVEDKKGSWYIFRCTSKPIHRFFTVILEFPKGYKTGDIDVLKMIKNASPPIQIAFIAGFCDGEGGIGISKKGPWIDIAQKSNTDKPPPILIWIKQKFEEMNLDFHGPVPMMKGAWRLRSSRKETILNYYKLISPRHPDKINKLEQIKVFSYAHRP